MNDLSMQSFGGEETTVKHGPEPRPSAPEHSRLAAPGHASINIEFPTEEDREPNEEPRPTTAEDKTIEEETTPERGLPNDTELVTVEEAVILFREAGLPRHIRTIQKYCARVSGRALVCHQTPTENGIRYLIEKASIDRFIKDATHQAPVGENEGFAKEPPQTPQEPQQHAIPQTNTQDIFEHPYVQKLEGQITSLSEDKDRLQKEIQNVLVEANERLVELQKASAIAQSESLGSFLLESERIRHKQNADQEPHSETA